MDAIKTTHHGIEVEYDEERDRWRFEIDGKERSAESLANARKAIDAPPPKPKAARTVAIPAITTLSYASGTFEFVTVTAQAEGSRQEYWIRDAKGTRRKERNLKADTPENRARVEQISELAAQRSALYDQITAITLDPFDAALLDVEEQPK